MNGDAGVTSRVDGCGYAPPLLCEKGFRKGSGEILTMEIVPFVAGFERSCADVFVIWVIISSRIGRL